MSNMDWKAVVLVSVLIAATAVLIGLGKIPAASFVAIATGVIGWLVPQPMKKADPS